MRHVSRTHRVALDWLFDRINLEPKVQIKYVDTQNQLADLLTKESFPRDEWNHLLRLFNKMSFSIFSCSHFNNFLSDPIGKQSAMSKRGQEATSSEGSPMAKPKPIVPAKARPVNLVLCSPWSARDNPPQNLGYPFNLGNVDEGQGSHTSTRRLVRTTQNPEVERSQVGRQENAQNSDSWKQGDQENLRTQPVQRDLYGQRLQVQSFQNMKYTNHQYMTKIFHFLQKKFGITAGYSTFSMKALKTNVLIWGSFMSSSMTAAIHLGSDYLQNLEVFKHANFEEIQSLFNVTQKLILEHSEEIQNVHTIESTSPSSTRSTLSHDQVIQWTEAKVRVHSDSVLCLVKMRAHKDATTRCEGQVEESKMSASYRELLGIDGEAIESEWNISQDLRHCRSFGSSRVICENGTSNLKSSQIGSSSCQCSTILIGQRKGNDEICMSNAEKVKTYAKNFSQGHGAFLGPGDDKNWYGEA